MMIISYLSGDHIIQGYEAIRVLVQPSCTDSNLTSLDVLYISIRLANEH